LHRDRQAPGRNKARPGGRALEEMLVAGCWLLVLVLVLVATRTSLQ
jgi:hypothetical protein